MRNGHRGEHDLRSRRPVDRTEQEVESAPHRQGRHHCFAWRPGRCHRRDQVVSCPTACAQGESADHVAGCQVEPLPRIPDPAASHDQVIVSATHRTIGTGVGGHEPRARVDGTVRVDGGRGFHAALRDDRDRAVPACWSRSWSCRADGFRDEGGELVTARTGWDVGPPTGLVDLAGPRFDGREAVRQGRHRRGRGAATSMMVGSASAAITIRSDGNGWVRSMSWPDQRETWAASIATWSSNQGWMLASHQSSSASEHAGEVGAVPVEKDQQLLGLHQRGGDTATGCRGGGADGVADEDQTGQGHRAGGISLSLVGVGQPPPGEHGGDGSAPVGSGPRRQGGDGAAGRIERALVPQLGELTVGGQPGDQGGERAVVVREHHHLVAGQVRDQTHRRVDGPLVGAGEQFVLARHVGEAAVAAQGRCAKIAGRVARPGPTRR